MGFLYNFVCDINTGEPLRDIYGNPIKRIVGVKSEHSKTNTTKKEADKKEDNKQKPTAEWTPSSQKKPILNDSGVPISIKTGYSSADVQELYGTEKLDNTEDPENE